MQNYTIVSLDVAHLEEICQDVREQYEKGIATMALFMVKLVPEGDPVIDKATLAAKKFVLFRDRLAEMGLRAGILVQCTIGHGYPLNQMFPFQRLINLKDGAAQNVVCPADEGAKRYFEEQFAILAALHPAVIMVDDDFRLMYRAGVGCACPLHMEAVRQRIGKKIGREELFSILTSPAHPRKKEYAEHFTETQRASLLEAARAMRRGIDRVDPRLPGVFCCVGSTTEFGGEIGAILAGEGNPVTVRINNGNYSPEGARHILRQVVSRCAIQASVLRQSGVDVILAETDTCPQNRYSTGAQSLHSHFVASLLEGLAGAKHWITRLGNFEPASGKAYRKKLAQNRGFYEAVSALAAEARWDGCRLPLAEKVEFDFNEPWAAPSNAWGCSVFERFGFPVYYSSEAGGVACLEGSLSAFRDEELREMLCRGALVASDAAAELCRRGMGEYLGVSVRPHEGLPISGEITVEGGSMNAQVHSMEIVPEREGVRVLSHAYHLKDGVEKVLLFPAVTLYQNPMGGRVAVFSGTPNAAFHYTTAFSFLNETRKAQIREILSQMGALPVAYASDEEVYVKTGLLPTGERVCALFNIGLDPIFETALFTEQCPVRIERLTSEGKREEVAFRKEGDTVVLDLPLFTLEPQILFLQ